MGLLALPLDTDAQARSALGVAANQLNRAYDVVATKIQGDNSEITNALDIAQASVQGLYAVVPNDGAPLAVALVGQISSSLLNAQTTLDTVADQAALPGATWDFGSALTGLLSDTVTTAGVLAGKLGAGAALALTPLLTEILIAVGVLVLLIVVLRRNGATLGGLL